MKLLRLSDHSPKGLAKVKRPVEDESPRLTEAGAADFRPGLARIGRARAAGIVAFVVAWSTKRKRFAPEYNERFGIHVNIEALLTFPCTIDTYEVMTQLQGGASRRARAPVQVPMLGCWSAGEFSIAQVLECSS